MGSSRRCIDRKPLCIQTDLTGIRADTLQYERDSITTSFESSFFSLDRFVLPPIRVKHLEIGNLYVRKRKDRKEFVRKVYSSPYKVIAKMSLGKEELAAATAAIERRIGRLQRELRYREDQERQTRIGFRQPRPYRYASVNLNPPAAPILEERHPKDYRRRRSSASSLTSNSAVSITSIEIDYQRDVRVEERRERRCEPDDTGRGRGRSNEPPHRPKKTPHRPSTPHAGPPLVPRRPEPAHSEPSRRPDDAIMQKCCCGRYWYLCRYDCCSRHRHHHSQRHTPPVIIRPEPTPGRRPRGSHEDDGLYHIQDRSPNDYS